MAEEVRIIRNKSTDRYSLVYESIGDQNENAPDIN